jgi:hypothetical protein
MATTKKTAAEAAGTANNSTKILSLVEDGNAMLKELIEKTNMGNAEMMRVLNEINTKVSSSGGGRSGVGKAGGAGSKAAPGSKKRAFAANSVAWFKEEYLKGGEAKEYLYIEFLPEAARGAVKTHMETDPDAKEKEGAAADLAEVVFLWEKFCKGKTAMLKKIKDVYEEKKKEFEAQLKTDAEGAKKEDEDSEPGDSGSSGSAGSK